MNIKTKSPGQLIYERTQAAMTQTKQAKHTPLPWELSEYHNGFKLEIVAQDGIVATVAGTSGTSEETEANAKLILKAVNSHEELLGALQAVDEMFSAPGRINKDSIRDMVRAAITKARASGE